MASVTTCARKGRCQKSKTRATKLLKVSGEYDLKLNHTERVDVISKLAPYSGSHTQPVSANDDRRAGEPLLDELLESIFRVN